MVWNLHVFQKILKSTLEDRQLKDDLATKKLTEEMEAIKAENTKLINENVSFLSIFYNFLQGNILFILWI